MTVQTAVGFFQGSGVVGELHLDSPHRANPGLLDSTDPANNVIGRVFTVKTDGGNAQCPIVQAGGDPGDFYGILFNPKVYANSGTAVGGSLAANLTLRNDELGEFLEMGNVFVTLPGVAAINDLVTYNTTTGILGSVAQEAAFTGVIAVTTGVLTVSALAAGGYIEPGVELSGTGIPAGTIITGQLSGTTGSNGTYQTNIITAVASTAMTAPNSALAAGAGNAFVPNTKVSNYYTSGAGLAVITLTN